MNLPLFYVPIETEIINLRAEINRHNELYYQKNEIEISDFEFDKLLEKLKQLEAEHPEFVTPDSPTQRVGGTITKNFNVVKHRSICMFFL